MCLSEPNRCQRAKSRCCFSYGCFCCCYSPGHLRLLAQGQQDGLGVDEHGPARQTEEEEDEDTPLEDHAHPLEVLPSIRLLTHTSDTRDTGKHRL